MMKEEDKELPVAKTEGLIVDDNPEKEEHFYFHLKDSVHEFTMGLGEIIRCLKFAENEGIVPNLPDDWWSAMYASYNGLYEQHSQQYLEGYHNGFRDALALLVASAKVKGKTVHDIENKLSRMTPEDLHWAVDEELHEE